MRKTARKPVNFDVPARTELHKRTSPIDRDIVVHRTIDTKRLTLDVHQVAHRSTDGCDVADIALSILDAIVPVHHDGLDVAMTNRGEHVSRTAMRLHLRLMMDIREPVLKLLPGERYVVKLADVLHVIESVESKEYDRRES